MVDYEPLLNGAVERAQWKPERSVVFEREMSAFTYKKDLHIDWNEVMASGSHVDAVPMLATDPLYILYTSGTTGKVRTLECAHLMKRMPSRFLTCTSGRFCSRKVLCVTMGATLLR